MFEKYNKLVIFDTETSSLSPDDGEIIEFGAIILTKPPKSNRFSEKTEVDVLIQNQKPILNSHIHHITDEMCRERGITPKKFFDVLEPLFGFYEDTLLIAYNAPFDLRFIQAFLGDRKIENDVLDLLKVAKARTERFRGNKLCDMIEYYEVKEVENSHRALDDVKATLEVMRAMAREKPDLENYIERRG